MVVWHISVFIITANVLAFIIHILQTLACKIPVWMYRDMWMCNILFHSFFDVFSQQ